MHALKDADFVHTKIQVRTYVSRLDIYLYICVRGAESLVKIELSLGYFLVSIHPPENVFRF